MRKQPFESHLLKIQLRAAVQWPPQLLKVASQTGKIELSFQKSAEDLWSNYGEHSWSKLLGFETEKMQFAIERLQNFNDDSFELSLKSQNVVMLMPVGQHLTLESQVKGKVQNIKRMPSIMHFILFKNYRSLD